MTHQRMVVIITIDVIDVRDNAIVMLIAYLDAMKMVPFKPPTQDTNTDKGINTHQDPKTRIPCD